MDSSVTSTRFPGVKLVQTTDFFYPLVDDPYMQGKIGCANVLSDLYAMGVVDCNTMMMILAASTEMEKQDKDISTRLMIEGFNDQAKIAGTSVTGGQTVKNPWPIIGGVATSICLESEIIMPVNAVPGDVLVLTKPLGTQLAVNVHQWMYTESKWDRVKDFMTKEDAIRAYELAMDSMTRLNRNGAKLMHKYGAHAATDVTGFGILGHGNNLAKNQKSAIHFEIHTLPIIKWMKEADEKTKIFNLMDGVSAETSGGLLICLPPEAAAAFCKEIEETEGWPAWTIGRVLPSTQDRTFNTCKLIPNPTIINV
jgi:selenide,water dikinase